MQPRETARATCVVAGSMSADKRWDLRLMIAADVATPLMISISPSSAQRAEDLPCPSCPTKTTRSPSLIERSRSRKAKLASGFAIPASILSSCSLGSNSLHHESEQAEKRAAVPEGCSCGASAVSLISAAVAWRCVRCLRKCTPAQPKKTQRIPHMSDQMTFICGKSSFHPMISAKPDMKPEKSRTVSRHGGNRPLVSGGACAS
mmetsp:Transcript_74119/g.191188  ORF Transcript_74119/g.191188 Transcript_74119/m.191188 type:complete len:204 (+) Transcript_74119:2900-3511(+)